MATLGTISARERAFFSHSSPNLAQLTVAGTVLQSKGTLPVASMRAASGKLALTRTKSDGTSERSPKPQRYSNIARDTVVDP